MRNVIVLSAKLIMGGVELSGCAKLTRWVFIFFNIPILVSYCTYRQLRYCIIAVAGAGIARGWNMANCCGERAGGSIIRRLY